MFTEEPYMRSTSSRHLPQQGFALIEALVGLVIFSLGIIGLLSSVATSTQLFNENRYRTEAVAIADELFGQMAVAKTSDLKNTYSQSSTLFQEWVENRVKTLPKGEAAIVFPGAEKLTDSAFVRLSISWQPPEAPSTLRNEYITTSYFK